LKILAQKETLTPAEKHEAMMGAAALREAAGAYHFGSAYDPVEASISNGYNALAGILENKYNGLKDLGIGALASIPNIESGYGSYLNNEAFQDLTRQNMYDPEIAGIVNQYNPFEDLKQNRPGVYYAGLVGGNLIQGAAGKAAGKALGLTAESAALPFDADEL